MPRTSPRDLNAAQPPPSNNEAAVSPRFLSSRLRRPAVAGIAIALALGVVLLGVTQGWNPRSIIAAPPDLTATAVTIEPQLKATVQTASQRTMRAAACACDPGLATAITGTALAHDLARIAQYARTIRHRTTIVHQWVVESARLLPTGDGEVSVYRNVSEYAYQGVVPMRRIDGAYRDRYQLASENGVWKVSSVQTVVLSQQVTRLAASPAATAQAVYILDDSTGYTLYASNANTERLVASTAKMVTALVAVAHLSLDAIVTVPPGAMVGGTSANLAVGERIRVRDLFYGMLLPSGNDAAATFAYATAGSIPAFAALMNAETGRLGLHGSHWITPHGLDMLGQYSTAHDLAWIARALLRQPFLATVVRTKEHTVTTPTGQYHDWVNLDHLLWTYPGAIGVKTGTTGGGGANLVAAAVRHHHRVIAVILGDTPDNRFPDATNTLNFAWQLLGYRNG